MVNAGQLTRLESDVGELLDSRKAGRSLAGLEAFEGDPVGFCREVLGGSPWAEQERVMRAVVDSETGVVWRGGNSVGKDWTVAALALWWAYVVRGLVLLRGPTARQVHEILMRRELARAKNRADLPGDLYTTALRLPGEEEASILAATSTEPGKLQGHHHPRGVLAILTEAQDVEGFAWEAAAACTTGERDRRLAVGNPLRREGRFYEVSRAGSGWRSFQTSAFEHPNLDPESDRWIAGGPSEAWLSRMREDYGEASPIWTARVEGDFPTESVHWLIRRSWLAKAAKRWARHATAGEAEEEGEREPAVCELDPSRMGVDASVLAVRRGDVLEEVLVWEGRHDATELVAKVTAALGARGVTRRVRGLRQRDEHGRPERVGEQKARGRVVVDEPGLGGPILDRLNELRFRATGHNGGKRAGDAERFFNRRAEVFWTLARKLEEGEVALCWDDALFEELTAIEYTITGSGKVQIEAKTDLKSRLGRSPDPADAVAIAFAEVPKAVDRPTAKVWGVR